MSVDCRGVTRGCCNLCSCFKYDGSESNGGKCKCGHPPTRHANKSMTSATVASPMSPPSPPPLAVMNATGDDDIQSGNSDSEDEAPSGQLPFFTKLLFGQRPRRSSSGPAERKPPKPAPRSLRSVPASRNAWGAPSLPFPQSPSIPLPTCRYPNCQEMPYHDLNTGESSDFCTRHMNSAHYLPTMEDDEDSALSFMMASFKPQGGEIAFDGPFSHTTAVQQPTVLFSPPGPFPPPGRFPPQLTNSGPPNPFIHSSQSVPNFHTVQQPQVPLVLPSPNQPVALLPDDRRCKYPMCNKKRYRESDGKVHEFCGRKHAREYATLKGDTIEPGMKCKTAGCTRQRRPREDGNGFYDYCGRSCRDGTFRTAPAAAGETCIFPNCTKPRYVDPANGRVHDYCGRTHANQAQAIGLAPQVCTLTLVSSSEMLQIQTHFKNEWCPKKGTCPTLTCAFKITNHQLETRWKAYGQKLPSGFQMVEKYYHGTKLKCDIVQSGSSCTDKDCGVCGISKLGMYRQCIRKNINFQRFGHGFYFAPNSSKCHDYTQGVNTHRAMLLVDIYPGKKHVILNNDVKLTQPPDGCHSVYGKPGQALNYAELVVYNPDCVMPRYIVVYVLNGVHKIAK